MLRQLLGKLAVTAAFAAGAVVAAAILDIGAVQNYLGMAALPAADLLRVDAALVGSAVLAGLVVDGLRLVAAKWWRGIDLPAPKLEDLLRSSLT